MFDSKDKLCLIHYKNKLSHSDDYFYWAILSISDDKLLNDFVTKFFTVVSLSEDATDYSDPANSTKFITDLGDIDPYGFRDSKVI